MFMTKDSIFKASSVLSPHTGSATATLLFWARRTTPGVSLIISPLLTGFLKGIKGIYVNKAHTQSTAYNICTVLY